MTPVWDRDGPLRHSLAKLAGTALATLLAEKLTEVESVKNLSDVILASNPAFQAEFFEKLLPLALEDPSLAGEAAGCIACHSPVTFARTKGLIYSDKDVNSDV